MTRARIIYDDHGEKKGYVLQCVSCDKEGIEREFRRLYSRVKIISIDIIGTDIEFVQNGRDE